MVWPINSRKKKITIKKVSFAFINIHRILFYYKKIAISAIDLLIGGDEENRTPVQELSHIQTSTV